MAVPMNPDGRRYYRVAMELVGDARLVLDELERPKLAVYIAGYVVECALKALVLASTPRDDRAEVLAGFVGGRAHNFEWLREQYDHTKGPVPLPGVVADDIAFVGTWSTDLRYEPGNKSVKDAERVLAAVERIWGWADGRL